MKRFRNAALAIYDLEDPSYYSGIQLVGEEALLSPASISIASGGTTVKEVSFIDPAIGEVPVFSDKIIPSAQPIITEPLLIKPVISPVLESAPLKEVSFIDPVIGNVPILSDKILPISQSIVSSPLVSSIEPVKEVVYVDTAISSPKLLTEEQIEVISQNKTIEPISQVSQEVTPSNNIVNVVDKVVDTINKSVNEIFATEVVKDTSVSKDQTGLYLAGAVVALGLLTLIFKK